MKNIKTERAAYAAWDYELEIDHLNEMSEQGWQLIHGGCFQTKYERDSSVVYRYQLDHNTKIENRLRYIDTFREQGWEYVNSTFNGWHYFRKVYDPKKPAEEYEIYSDRPSKQEMAGRLGRLMTVLAVIVGLLFAASVVSFILSPRMAMLGIIVEMLAALIITCTGAVRMRGVGRGKASARRFLVAALIAVALAGLAWFMVFASAETLLEQNWASVTNGYGEVPFQMSLPDWMDITVQCCDTQEMTVTISGDNGFERTYNAVMDENIDPSNALFIRIEHLFLTPGDYVLQVECASGAGGLSVEVD